MHRAGAGAPRGAESRGASRRGVIERRGAPMLLAYDLMTRATRENRLASTTTARREPRAAGRAPAGGGGGRSAVRGAARATGARRGARASAPLTDQRPHAWAPAAAQRLAGQAAAHGGHGCDVYRSVLRAGWARGWGGSFFARAAIRGVSRLCKWGSCGPLASTCARRARAPCRHWPVLGEGFGARRTGRGEQISRPAHCLPSRRGALTSRGTPRVTARPRRPPARRSPRAASAPAILPSPTPARPCPSPRGRRHVAPQCGPRRPHGGQGRHALPRA
jgi:hypothetical protein